MNSYIILLFYMCRTIDGYDYGHYSLSPNVGTVLFNTNDLKKDRWTKAEICLLRARRHFQKLIPPPASLQTSDANFVNKLIKYFHSTYSSVKRESDDPQTDRIMTTALSDAIGGYLKLWVLPIVKYGYYGGTVNQQDITKLYKFYRDIKSYLHTDGNNWRSPDGNLMRTLTINIAPLKHVYNTRSMRNPCEHLAFFEKSDTGLSVPMPFINWNDESSTMFIPLKNESLVYLTSPNSTTALFKYHDVAKNCIERSKPAEQSTFEDKFQNWVSKDIVPHLEDDNLYLGLWSVLSLMNKTVDSYATDKPPVVNLHKYLIGGYTIDMSQRKVLLLIVIVVIEIVWCIPAMIYMICKRKRVKERDICLMIESASDNDYRKPHKASIIECRKPRIESHMGIKKHRNDSDIIDYRKANHGPGDTYRKSCNGPDYKKSCHGLGSDHKKPCLESDTDHRKPCHGSDNDYRKPCHGSHTDHRKPYHGSETDLRKPCRGSYTDHRRPCHGSDNDYKKPYHGSHTDHRKPCHGSDNDYKKPRKHTLFEDKNVGSDPIPIPDKKPEQKIEAKEIGCQGHNFIILQPRLRNIDVETNQVIKNSVALDSGIQYSSKMCSTDIKINHEPGSTVPKKYDNRASKKDTEVVAKVCEPQNKTSIPPTTKKVCGPPTIHKVLTHPSPPKEVPCPIYTPDTSLKNSCQNLDDSSADGDQSSIEERPSPSPIKPKQNDSDKTEKPQIKICKTKNRESSQVKANEKPLVGEKGSKVNEKSTSQVKDKVSYLDKEKVSSQVKEKAPCQDKEKSKTCSKHRVSSQIKEEETVQIKDIQKLPKEKDSYQLKEKERCFVNEKESQIKEKKSSLVKDKGKPDVETSKCIVKVRTLNQGKAKQKGKNELSSNCNEKEKTQDCSQIFKKPEQPKLKVDTEECPCPKNEDESSLESDDPCPCPCPHSPEESAEEDNLKCLCKPCYVSCQYDRSSQKKESTLASQSKPIPFKKTRFRVQNEIISGKNKPEKCEKPGKIRDQAHYVEVRIDRPGNEITVGFGGKSKVKSAAAAVVAAASSLKGAKPSKIPKRTSNEPCCCLGPVKPPSPPPVRRSLIPQPKRYTTDDIAIKPNKAPQKDKLNVTL